MAVEAKRGCGFRKVGGLYLVGEATGLTCDRLPYPVGVCPTCSHGIKPSRGIRWMDGGEYFGGNCKRLQEEVASELDVKDWAECHRSERVHCPLCYSGELGTVGFMWVGEKFYPTPQVFELEASQWGVSKRIAQLPKELVLGETWILLVHPKGVREKLPDEKIEGIGTVERFASKPAIFHAFQPVRVEKIVTDLTPGETLEKLKKRGITPVVVPHNDPDHCPGGAKTKDQQEDLGAGGEMQKSTLPDQTEREAGSVQN